MKLPTQAEGVSQPTFCEHRVNFMRKKGGPHGKGYSRREKTETATCRRCLNLGRKAEKRLRRNSLYKRKKRNEN